MRQYILAVSGVLLHAGVAFAMSMKGSSVFFEERPALVSIDGSVVGLKTDLGRSSKFINSKGERSKLGSDFSEKVVTAQGEVTRHYQVEATYTQFTPYWGYGVTSTWSIFAAVPITHVSSVASASYSTTGIGLNEINPRAAFASRDKSSVRAPYDNQEDTVVGQFYFVNQFEWLRRAEYEIVLLQKLRIPTGEHDSLEYYTNGSPDPSGYGLEFGVLTNFDGPALTQILMSAKGAINFADTIYGYKSGKEGTGKLERIRRDPGETIEASLGVERELFFDDFVLSADYSFIRNFGDKLETGAVAFVEASEAHLIRTAVAYRPPSYLARTLWGDLNYSGRVIYSQVIAGENVPDFESIGLELSINY